MILIALLLAGLIVSALAGPWLLRRAAPALVHVPRLAVFILAASIVFWLLALLAVGPMLAWIISGPVLLPGQAADVCQRCLASANPFAGTTIDTAVPAVLLLAIPTLAALGLVAAAVYQGRQRARATKHASRPLRTNSMATTLHGHRVLVIHDPRPCVFTLPARHGGVVVSDAALTVLSDVEMAGVLEHEHAHLRQHHHLITSIVASTARRLRWIPLVAAAADAIPHYLEITADNAARGPVGTPALASALLKLGEPTHPASTPAVGVLNAAGPDRIRHLVSPGDARGGIWPAIVIGASLATLAIVNAAVHMPYLGAVVAGCA